MPNLVETGATVWKYIKNKQTNKHARAVRYILDNHFSTARLQAHILRPRILQFFLNLKKILQRTFTI
jgi:hypothetical protein